MKIAVIGSGYVGTTLAAALADAGHEVTAIDIDEEIVERLNAGEVSIHEPGLDDLVAEHAGGRLTATTDYDAIRDARLVFVAVPTPSNADGTIDVTAVREASISAVQTLMSASGTEDGHVLVIKSTVTPPQLSELLSDVEAIATGSPTPIELAVNPEFLREGTALQDLLEPDKVVFGVDSDAAEELLREAYAPVHAEVDPTVIVTDPETAAMIKYANNAFLAAKISLINDIGNIAKEFGLDAYEVAEAIGCDHRISESFLRSGAGFGGSCFPKDVNALISASTEAGYAPELLQAAMAVNETQPLRMLELLERHVDPAGKRIAVLGLSFKCGTDDIRESRAIPIIEGLQLREAEVVAYDPVASENMRERFPDIEYAETAGEALDGAHAAMVMTDWPEFAELSREFYDMAEQIVIDGRRIVEPPHDVTYEGLTW